jgi:hypothetical protein
MVDRPAVSNGGNLSALNVANHIWQLGGLHDLRFVPPWERPFPRRHTIPPDQKHRISRENVVNNPTQSCAKGLEDD